MIRREPSSARVFQDFLRLVFLAIIVSAFFFFALRGPFGAPVWRDFTRRAVGAVTAQLLATLILRLVVPRPKPGSFLVGRNWGYISWLMGGVFAEVAMNPILRAPFWFFYMTRHLYLRVLGARLAWGVGFPSDLLVRDPSLVHVERGAQIENGVIFENAVHSAGRVHIEPITIGGGTLVGAHTILMPGATIGHDAKVASGAYVGAHVRIGVGASIGERAVIAARVDVGSYAVVGPGAVLSEGVTLGDRSKVLPGVVVPPNTNVPERVVWGEKTEELERRVLGLPKSAETTATVKR